MTVPDPSSARQKPRVKIDGLRDSANALVAADAGADFLGFVFVEDVRRQLRPDEGQWITEGYLGGRQGVPNGPQLVGLFRDQPVDWVRHVAERCHLHIAQLCGDEDPSYADELIVPVIKQIRVREEETAADLRARVKPWLDAGHMAVLDAYDPSTPGGTGKTFDWSAAEGVVERAGIFLAGGLNPENVSEAVQRLNPWGVDVSSGVETDGRKDPDKIRDFIDAAKAA
ncbi:MAG: phosphoribosylanthranilate isomerase [Chloroflexi bacterium]|nr:phosphoribosylanthranilate isomerase [Chloroflexota bacterium]MCH8223545.1 phosphoribosylanthranilate isomerase [Chloroflexota bacterium]